MKNMKMLLVLGMAGGLMVAIGVAQTRSATDLYQEALHMQEVKGDLAKAIDLYRTIVDRYPGDQAIAPKALLEMAADYEKLGKPEAVDVYQRIVRDFTGQAEVAALARARMVALGVAQRADGISERVAMTTIGFGLEVNSMTPDGRLGVGIDQSNGDLVVRDMTTGAVTRLLKGTLDPRRVGTPEDASRYLETPVLSPDSRQVALTRYSEAGSAQLWVVMNRPDAPSRLVTTSSEYRLIRTFAWSPDKSSLLVWFVKGVQPSQLAWISMTDGSERVIKSLEPGLPLAGTFELSPDGRYIAYARRSRAGSPDQSIFILVADGSGNEAALTQTTGVNDSPMWTADGRNVLFVSNRSGTLDMWAVPVRSGRVAGASLMLRKNIGPIDTIGMTRTGSLYYRSRVGTPSRTTVQSNTVAQSVGNSWVVSKLDTTGGHMTWSPDGKVLAFARIKSAASGTSTNWMIILKTLDTGEERIVAQDQGYGGGGPRWFPDGKSLLVNANTGFSASPSNGSVQSLARVDVTGQAAPKMLFTFDRRVNAAQNATLARDGKTVYFPGTIPKEGKFVGEATYGLLKLDLDTQVIETIVPFPKDSVLFADGAGLPRLSPDGRTLAYTTFDKNKIHVMTVSVDGGAPREVFTDLNVAVFGAAWTSDSRGLFLGRRVDANRWQIVRLDLENGIVQDMTIPIDGRANFDASWDGSRIAIYTSTPFSETKVLDNVLSALK